MDEHICLTVLSHSSESDEQFQKRLIAFWSNMIRTRPEEYKQVYAESAKSELVGSRLLRRYLVALDIAETLEQQLAAAGIEHEEIDRDDVYSKYEATPPEWFLIPH